MLTAEGKVLLSFVARWLKPSNIYDDNDGHANLILRDHVSANAPHADLDSE